MNTEALSRILELSDYIIPFTLRAVAALGVADCLANGPREIEDVAVDVGAHAPSLHRALRALAARGIFIETRPGCFGLTPMAELLRQEHPLSLRDLLFLPIADIQAWSRADDTLRTGAVAFERVHGCDYWTYFAAHPEESSQFDLAMAAWSRLELLAVSRVCDWDGLRTVVDVGGGNGTFLAGLLVEHPNLRGILFDQPHVVAGAKGVFAAAGVQDRCDIVAGNFFESACAGADAYVLKRIIYSWDDHDAATILRHIRRRLSPNGRVLILEPVYRKGNSFDMGRLLDLQMLMLGGYRVRSRGELRRLLNAAELRLTRVIPTFMLSVIEAVPA